MPKTRAELDREITILDQASLIAIGEALDAFNAAVAKHIPETNMQGGEAGYVIQRVTSQSLAFKDEVVRALAQIDAKLNPPKPDFNGNGGIGPRPSAI